MRYGAQFGPDITFLGVDPADLDDPDTYRDADVVILGAPFDGGTSYRSGARFGPKALRETCYLAHDGSRPSLAMRVDGLQDLRVVDIGDVEMFSGDAARSCADLEAAVEKVATTGAIPLILGGDHTVTWPDVTGVARGGDRWGRVSVIHFDAHADTGDIEFGSLIAPLLFAQVLLATGDIHWLYWSFAIVSVPMAIWFWFLQEPKHAGRAEEASSRIFPGWPVLVMAALFFLIND